MIFKFQENRVWRAYTGGKRIDRFYGKDNAKDGRMPEEWIASTVEAFNPDRPVKGEGLSICDDGKVFRDMLEEDPEGILGAALSKKYNGKLSILVKLLDSAERLVIQCHPTVPFAMEHFNSMFGKSECWYMLDCDDSACVYLGFKPGVTRQKWVELFEKQDTEGMLSYLHKFPVQNGDLWFVNGGVPHAIGGGCLMIELQEPSDLMVIPERITPAGIVLSEQKLHCGLGFDTMFDCFSYTGLTEEETKAKYYRQRAFQSNTLVDIVDKGLTENFSMKALQVSGEAAVEFGAHCAVAIVISGAGELKTVNCAMKVRKSDNFFISANSGKIKLSGNAEFIFCIAQ